jgi:hypothetical protein
MSCTLMTDVVSDGSAIIKVSLRAIALFLCVVFPVRTDLPTLRTAVMQECSS